MAATWSAIGLVAAFAFGSLFYLGHRIDALAARMDARFDAHDARFDGLQARMDARFDAMMARLDAHLDRHIG
jgi:hypothetical protein